MRCRLIEVIVLRDKEIFDLPYHILVVFQCIFVYEHICTFADVLLMMEIFVAEVCGYKF